MASGKKSSSMAFHSLSCVSIFSFFIQTKIRASPSLCFSAQPLVSLAPLYWELSSSSQYSTARLVWGMQIEPPTKLAMAKTSNTSSLVTPFSWQVPRW